MSEAQRDSLTSLKIAMSVTELVDENIQLRAELAYFKKRCAAAEASLQQASNSRKIIIRELQTETSEEWPHEVYLLSSY